MEETGHPRVGGDQGWAPTTWAEGLTRYMGHWPKRRGAAPFQILDIDLFRELLLTRTDMDLNLVALESL